MNLLFSRRQWVAAAAVALVVSPVVASAQAWPAKPIRIIVAYPAGA